MTAVIRPATLADLAEIVVMGSTFMEGVRPYSHWPPKPDVLMTTATQMITEEAYTILVADVDGQLEGMLGLACYRHPLFGELTVSELFWWVSPEHRGRTGLKLLHAGEKWAAEQGASSLFMGAPNTGIEKLYEAKDFQRLEVSYYKLIEPIDRNGYTVADIAETQETT